MAKINRNEEYFERAYRRYQTVLDINPCCYEAYTQWGLALLDHSSIKSREEMKKRLLESAGNKKIPIPGIKIVAEKFEKSLCIKRDCMDSLIDSILNKEKNHVLKIFLPLASLSKALKNRLAFHFSRIKTIDLSWCKPLTRELLALVVELGKSHLEAISFNQSALYSSFIEDLSVCNNLTSLKLGGCMLINDNHIVELSTKFRVLKKLVLSGTAITNSSIKQVSESWSNSLIKLDLARCNGLSDGYVNDLRNCTNLEKLYLRKSEIETDSFISLISNMKALKSLDIGYCKKNQFFHCF